MNRITRRQAAGVFATLATAPAAKSKASRLSLEGYIFQNLAAREKRPLAEMVDDLFASAADAGFVNLEVNHGFFVPALRDKVLALTRKHKFGMPSVYVGGAMHEEGVAEKTIARALEIGGLCKEFGCNSVVNNPDTKGKDAFKSDAELDVQAKMLNRMGAALAAQGLQLRIHHHTTEMADQAREFRHILKNTEARAVTLCIDVEHAQRGGMEPNALIREGGPRVTEIHLRNKIKTVPLEAFAPGDIDHDQIAATLKSLKITPLVVLELAYHSDTVVTRSFRENLKASRIYAEKTFHL